MASWSVALSLVSAEGGKVRVRFEIEDTGRAGSPIPRCKARLFEPFEQGASDIARRYGS